jgi:membrane protease YdiL (CAAX protease family)
VPAAAAALVTFVLAALVVLPRFLTMPVERVTFLDAYLRRPYGVVAVLVTVAVIAPLLEEFLFRGWMQRTLERRTTPWRAIGLTALVFAAVHLEGYGFVLRLAFGVAAGYAAWSTSSIWPSVVLHGAYNGSLVALSSVVPSLDQRTMLAWAHTPSVFWPAVLAMAVAGGRGRVGAAPHGPRRPGGPPCPEDARHRVGRADHPPLDAERAGGALARRVRFLLFAHRDHAAADRAVSPRRAPPHAPSPPAPRPGAAHAGTRMPVRMPVRVPSPRSPAPSCSRPSRPSAHRAPPARRRHPPGRRRRARASRSCCGPPASSTARARRWCATPWSS